MRPFLALLAALALPGCATIIEGSSQSVAVDTDPPGALCHVSREGSPLGDVGSTPGSLKLGKSKNDLTVACSKDGYQTATVSQAPKFQGTTFGNIIAGGVIGVIVDASTGANYEYPANVHLSLAPISVAPVATSQPQPSVEPVVYHSVPVS